MDSVDPVEPVEPVVPVSFADTAFLLAEVVVVVASFAGFLQVVLFLDDEEEDAGSNFLVDTVLVGTLMRQLLEYAAFDPSGCVDCLAVGCDAQETAVLLHCNWGHYARCSLLIDSRMSVALVVLGALLVLMASNLTLTLTTVAGDYSSTEVVIYTPGNFLVYVYHWFSMSRVPYDSGIVKNRFLTDVSAVRKRVGESLMIALM